MKRAFSLLLAVALAAALLVGSASAASQPALSVTAVQSDDGSTVTATVHVAQTVPLAGLQFTLTYDGSLMSVTGDPVVGGAAAKMSYICNPDKENKVILVAYSTTDVENSGGDLLTVTFAVKSGASGSASFGLTDDMLINGDLAAISAGEPAAKTIAVRAPGTVVTPVDPTVVSGGDIKTDTESTPFTDCSGHWAESYIAKAVKAGLVNGMGNNLYQPDATMTRAQFVTILWRYAGSPEPKSATPFTDLDKTQTWYLKAVAWAYENGVINGVGNGKFGPGGAVTREQMMTILFRYSGKSAGVEQSLYGNAFRDGDQISDWAKTAIYWAVYNDVFCGVSAVKVGDTLAPGSKATRAQIAVVMVKYSEAFAK